MILSTLHYTYEGMREKCQQLSSVTLPGWRHSAIKSCRQA